MVVYFTIEIRIFRTTPFFLYTLYINDLSRVPQASELESLVDDSKIFMSFPIEDIASAKTKIEEDLKLVAAWFFENKLLINPGKTKLLLIGTRQLLVSSLRRRQLHFLEKRLHQPSNHKCQRPGINPRQLSDIRLPYQKCCIILYGQAVSDKQSKG